MRRVIKYGALFLIGISALLLVAYSYLLFTRGGGILLSRLFISRSLQVSDLAIGQARGSLARGLTLSSIAVPSLSGRLSGSTLRLAQADVRLRRLFPSLAIDMEWEGLEFSGTPIAREIRVERAEGRLPGLLTLRDVALAGLIGFPQEGRLTLQRLETVWPFQLDHVRVLQNAALRLPYSEPILVSGTQEGLEWSLHVYVKSLDVQEALGAIPSFPTPVRFRGVLKDVDLLITGRKETPVLAGRLEAAELSRNGLTLLRCPATVNLRLSRLSSAPQLHGEVMLSGGRVKARGRMIELSRGRMVFSGDPAAPSFDMQGFSIVGGETIHIALQGTKDKPDLRLSSDPPLSQEALLMMLATGKRWRGAQEALSQGAISSELATDFIDYFFFGGFGSRLAKRFGISELSLRQDSQTKRFGIETTLVDKVTVGVEVQPPDSAGGVVSSAPPSQKPPIPYKVEAEMQVSETTSLQVEGEGLLNAPRAPGGSSPDSHQAGSGPLSDEKVLLKVKKRF